MSGQQWTDQQVEQAMGNLLRAGVILGAAVVLLGGVIYLARHGGEAPDYATFHPVPLALRTLDGTLEAAKEMQGRGIIQVGVLLLIATPVARVVMSVVAFGQQRDVRYIVVTLVVLSVLLYSLVRGYRDGSSEKAAGRLPPLDQAFADSPHRGLSAIGNADLA
jgi:uncharacterized membrane protein